MIVFLMEFVENQQHQKKILDGKDFYIDPF